MARQKQFVLLLTALVSCFAITSIAAPPSGKGGGSKLTLTLQLYSSRISERMGPNATYGLVTRDTKDLNSELVVTLEQSSEPPVATVPPSVTIPAGEDSALFPVGTLQDGDEVTNQVTISASASGTEATAVLIVLDDHGLPPVEYVATRVSIPASVEASINDFNGWGMAVGGSEAASWLYDPLFGEVENLNDLTIDWGPLDPSDWMIGAAYGLNNTGLMVGSVLRMDEELIVERRGFVLDLTTTKISLLPDTGHGWVDTLARKVNDKGDILGWFQRADETWGIYFFNPLWEEDELEIVPYVSSGVFEYLHTVVTNPLPADTTKVIFEVLNLGYLYEFARGDDSITPLNPQTSTLDGRVLSSQTNDQGDIAASEYVRVSTGKGRKVTHVLKLYLNFVKLEPQFLTIDPDSFDVQSINNARTTLLTVRDADGTEYCVLHNNADGFTQLDALISTGGTRVDFGLMNRDLPGGAVLGYTQIATLNESLTELGQWDLVILTPTALGN